MGKRANRAKRAKRGNPLGPRASRVEKSRVEKAHVPKAGLPSWYHRVFRRTWKRKPFSPIDPSLFDEDLSELEDDAEYLENKDEHCGRPGDHESERSYDGPNADMYYAMKEEREKRKREKLQEKKQNQVDKGRRVELEKSKEDEVRAVHESLKNADQEPDTIDFESLVGHRMTHNFKLFNSDHVKHFYHNEKFYPRKEVEFWEADDLEEHGTIHRFLKGGKQKTSMFYGCVELDPCSKCQFGPFWLPSRASLKPVKVESEDGKHKLSLQFLGNKYLKLKVSRDFVFQDPHNENPEDPPPSAPREFEFVGIWYDQYKEWTEAYKKRQAQKALERKKELEETKKSRRSPSPKESWFELNHPMGAYYTGGWRGPW